MRGSRAHTEIRRMREFRTIREEIQRIRNAYGRDIFNFVFLATDDDGTVKEARKDAKRNGYRLLVAPVDRTWYSPKTWEKNRDKYSKGMAKRRRESDHFKVGFIERRLKAGDGDPDRVGAETATDVELLASGDAFIGTFTSNLGRLAFEVMSRRGDYEKSRRLPPSTVKAGITVSPSVGRRIARRIHVRWRPGCNLTTLLPQKARRQRKSRRQSEHHLCVQKFQVDESRRARK